MADEQPPKSPTLLVPRKSVELEDPGAHELESSNDEEEVFTDARESDASPSSPIPTTRVEKVDDAPSHGDLPGTEAYDKRTQDAIPDEIAVIPENKQNRPSPIAINSPSAVTPPQQSPIPMTRVEKVDPTSPSHGEVPGTPAYAKRVADAIPDAIVKAPEAESPPIGDEPTEQPVNHDIPKTVITRVDSEPRHGEVPEGGRSESESQSVNLKSPTTFWSPIAEDGGFGPMNSGDDSDEEEENDNDESIEDNDFEEFSEGAEVDDFGDFDDGFQDPAESDVTAPQQPSSLGPPTFPVLDFESLDSLEAITEAIAPHCAALFPSTMDPPPDPPEPLPDTNSTFLSERSLSLWSQLVAPPPLQPPNWVRSRIRRLFLVSLGVPVDLDEILPKSKQKKLVLPYTSTESKQAGAKGSAARLKAESGDGTDSRPSTPTTVKSTTRKRKGPPPPPAFNMLEVRSLCAKTNAELELFSDNELKAHVKRLDELVDRGKEVLQYWIRRKEAAVGEKEAFDGVIENLVRHARKVRK